MATNAPKDAGASAKTAADAKMDWSALMPKSVAFEDAMDANQVKKTWGRIMKEIGKTTADEIEFAAVRLAVYVYGALNGTSRAGAYKGTIVTASGTTFNASVIARAAGYREIRRFYRGNMEESYKMFKESGVMENYPRFVARAVVFGAGAGDAFAIADWLSDCPLFTTSERTINEAAFAYGIERAKRARGGRSLEEIEAAELKKSLHVQGPIAADDEPTGSSW